MLNQPPPGPSLEEYKRVVHELQTHQIELEMQNEELRCAEMRVREASKRYADLYNFAPTGYFTLTRRGCIRELNLKGAVMLGRDRIELVGLTLQSFLIPANRLDLLEHIAHTLAGPGSRSCVVQLAREGQEPVYLQLDSEPWVEPLSQRQFVRAAVSDISHLKRIETELREAKDKAEKASEMKTHFLATMSHEMRTPLGAILGFTELLAAESALGANANEAVETIRRNGQHLLALIDDILDLAKIEAGQMRVEALDLDLRAEILEVLAILKPAADRKRLTLAARIPEDINSQVVTDPRRLRQVLLNIVGNAIKFTEKGRVQVDVRSEEAVAEGTVAVDVEDSGCGIAPAAQELLFKPFSQADASMTRRYGGTGLGLCLSRHLAQALGGNVWLLHSAPGKGSSFRLTFGRCGPQQVLAPVPVAPGSEVKAEAGKTASKLQGLHVLLVEDGLDNQRLYCKMINRAGAHVDCANNGQDGVEQAMAGSYDLILMDIGLPKLDGYQATAMLRGKGYMRPILALSAHAYVQDRQRAIDAGFDAYIAKPVKMAELTATMAMWAQTEHEGAGRGL